MVLLVVVDLDKVMEAGAADQVGLLLTHLPLVVTVMLVVLADHLADLDKRVLDQEVVVRLEGPLAVGLEVDKLLSLMGVVKARSPLHPLIVNLQHQDGVLACHRFQGVCLFSPLDLITVPPMHLSHPTTAMLRLRLQIFIMTLLACFLSDYI